ncbi:MAG: CHC2 zinc finger domain-containing protein, partial [Candidatus Magasanikbacteria bacterium]|nr:CHC2 zinc finger domain-containing protein [Candidatus Magasanikbacteria bacterium]
HCFGCNIGGDIFEFLLKMENLEFPEALKLLADKAGVKLPEFKGEMDASQRNRILDILKLAAKFYHKILMDYPKAEEAREYLFKKRGVSKTITEDFLIGYIPEEWDLLTSFLIKKGFGINDIVAAGLTIKKDGG